MVMSGSERDNRRPPAFVLVMQANKGTVRSFKAKRWGDGKTPNVAVFGKYLVFQIAFGLHVMRGLNVHHNDLHPDNVM
jgi:hypothetical protein